MKWQGLVQLFPFMFNVCPKSLDPFYIVTYYIKWVKTSWTYLIISLF